MEGYFAEAEPNYYHDYFFSLGLLSFEHIEEIPYIVEELGITSFKWYKNYKDVAPEKFGTDSEMHDDWADAFIQALAAQDVPTTLGHHSENMEITSALGDNPYLDSAVDEDQEYRDYDVLVDQFPDYAETQSMTASGSLARQHDYDDSFYAVHISAGRTADELAMLHDAGWDITGETCTHYLTLTAEECDERHNVNPPVRSKEDQETLWEARRRRHDLLYRHRPLREPARRQGRRGRARQPPRLPLDGDDAPADPLGGVNEGRISLERAVEVTSTNTAKAFDIYPKKGSVQVGTDADLTVVDLDETKTVTPELLRSGADYSPYEGARGDRVADAHGRSRSGRLRGGARSSASRGTEPTSIAQSDCGDRTRGPDAVQNHATTTHRPENDRTQHSNGNGTNSTHRPRRCRDTGETLMSRDAATDGGTASDDASADDDSPPAPRRRDRDRGRVDDLDRDGRTPTRGLRRGRDQGRTPGDRRPPAPLRSPERRRRALVEVPRSQQAVGDPRHLHRGGESRLRGPRRRGRRAHRELPPGHLRAVGTRL